MACISDAAVADNGDMSSQAGGIDGGGWRTARGWLLDTAVTPDWLRTGYRYFPYAARQDGQWWTLRANYCFPAHDFATLFIDDSAVAEITASAKDARPLVASIGRLSMTHPERARIPVLSPRVAKHVIDAVAEFINHGSEWGDACDLCEFADRDPFEPATP